MFSNLCKVERLRNELKQFKILHKTFKKEKCRQIQAL